MICKSFRFCLVRLNCLGGFLTVQTNNKAALGFSNSFYASRIFHALDEDGSATLEFNEFVRGFFLLSTRAPKEAKVDFTFRIYDVNGNGE